MEKILKKREKKRKIKENKEKLIKQNKYKKSESHKPEKNILEAQLKIRIRIKSTLDAEKEPIEKIKEKIDNNNFPKKKSK